MNKEEVKSLNALVAEFKEFKGTITEFKEATKKSLSDNGTQLTAIQNKLASNPICLFHAEIVERIEKHEAGNAAQNKDIVDLQKKDIEIVSKLTPREKIKLDVASGGTIGTIVLIAIEIMKRVFGIGL